MTGLGSENASEAGGHDSNDQGHLDRCREQLQGGPLFETVDACALYRPTGDRTAAFLWADGGAGAAQVLERDPDLERVPRHTYPKVRELLRRCLEKDPRRRLRDIGEARPTRTPRPARSVCGAYRLR